MLAVVDAEVVAGTVVPAPERAVVAGPGVGTPAPALDPADVGEAVFDGDVALGPALRAAAIAAVDARVVTGREAGYPVPTAAGAAARSGALEAVVLAGAAAEARATAATAARTAGRAKVNSRAVGDTFSPRYWTAPHNNSRVDDRQTVRRR